MPLSEPRADFIDLMGTSWMWPRYSDEALRDPVSQTPEDYVGRNGFSWIHRWSRAKGMPNKGEPDPPAWVMTGF